MDILRIADELRADGELGKPLDEGKYAELMSYPVEHRWSISCGCELLGWIRRCEKDFRDDWGVSGVSVAGELLCSVIEELNRYAQELCKGNRGIELGREWWQDLSIYLRGTDDLGVLKRANEERWGIIRERIRGLLDRELRRLVVPSAPEGNTGIAGGMGPVVEQLRRESIESVSRGEVTGRDAVKLYGEMARLYGQLTGELKSKAELEVGPNELWLQMLRGLPSKEVDLEAEFEVLE